jgi:hypothetical protein
MKKIILYLAFLLLSPDFTFCQNWINLESYLKENHFSINLDNLEEKQDNFQRVIQGKKLFVLAEGGSHNLKMYKSLKTYLVYQLADNNLKYSFVEYGRSHAYFFNQYLAESEETTKHPSLESYMKPLKNLHKKGFQFEYRGIDMERPKNFYNAMRDILKNYFPQQLNNFDVIKEILTDTTYLHYEEKVFISNQKYFLDKYRIWKKTFAKDSTKIKQTLSESEYQKVRYLLTNNQTNHPRANRNPGMAENLLGEVSTNDTAATYFLSIGNAHSSPNNRGLVVGILNKDEKLKNKILVMNVYCESCRDKGVETNDRLLKFMENDRIKEIFRRLSVNQFTVFDLSKIPAEFDYLKEYGDLVLYTKNQE